MAHWLRAARDALLGEMPILAGGTALFAIFAVVPTLAAVVAIYGVVADPHEIQTQLRGLQAVLPPDVLTFVTSSSRSRPSARGASSGSRSRSASCSRCSRRAARRGR